MKKIYYLSTCSTCKRILSEVKPSDDFIRQDIKTEPITQDQVEEMARLAGSYEALFSRVARKYKELGLKDKSLTEEDYKNYILNEYTFLKRPVFIIDEQIFIGSSKKNVQALSEKLNS
jgi:arsenate reductase